MVQTLRDQVWQVLKSRPLDMESQILILLENSSREGMCWIILQISEGHLSLYCFEPWAYWVQLSCIMAGQLELHCLLEDSESIYLNCKLYCLILVCYDLETYPYCFVLAGMMNCNVKVMGHALCGLQAYWDMICCYMYFLILVITNLLHLRKFSYWTV